MIITSLIYSHKKWKDVLIQLIYFSLLTNDWNEVTFDDIYMDIKKFIYIWIKKTHIIYIKSQIFLFFSEASEKKRNICDFK